jgi:hypothetical protein
VAKVTDHADGAYHRWGGRRPALTTFGYRSQHARLVGQTVTLTRPLTDPATGQEFAAGTRAKCVQATPRGLVLRVGGVRVGGVRVGVVGEEQ